MRRRMAAPVLLALMAAAFLAGCASTPARTEGGVLQFIDIRNESSESVLVTARVGASPEQTLGTLSPTQFRRFEVATGAASTDELFLRARNPETGREATTTLTVQPGRTLQWSIRM